MRGAWWHTARLWVLLGCLCVPAARGQTPPSSGSMWFEVESNTLSFGTLDPEVDPLPQPLVVRVHSDQAWALKLLPSPGLVVDTGEPIPLDRLHWRPNATGLFLPFDTNGPLTIASGAPTPAAGTLVLVELLLRLGEADPIGQYQYNLRLALGAANAEAAPSPFAATPGEANDATVTVMANNFGLFECTVGTLTFDFGDIDVNGSDHGTVDVVAKGRNASSTGGAYESVAGAIPWTCITQPPSTVTIALVSSPADHTGGMGGDNLEARISTTAGGVSSGYQVFSSGADLITGMASGIGANAARGRLDLRLTVFDTDPLGINTWLVRLRATGNP